jgi:uncharacterized YigZ family protein
MIFEYTTLAQSVLDVVMKEKGSKFLGYAYPISNEVDAKEKLNYLWTIHPKATHICYAYRIGLKGEIYRANDDGEPSGSAGLPIYNQLLAHDVTQVLVAVVRYYGGTKLGVSGLVKAYKECAKIALEQAEIILKELECTLEIQFNFNQQNLIFTLLNKFDAQVLQFDAQEKCIISALIKMAKKEGISELLSEMPYVEFQFVD